MKKRIAVSILAGLMVLTPDCDVDTCEPWWDCTQNDGASESGGPNEAPNFDGMDVCEVLTFVSQGTQTCDEQATLGGLNEGELLDGSWGHVTVDRVNVLGPVYTYQASPWPSEGNIGYPTDPDIIKGHFMGVRASPEGDGYLWLVGSSGMCPDVVVHWESVQKHRSMSVIGTFSGSASPVLCAAELPGGITGVNVMQEEPVAIGFRLGSGSNAVDENEVSIRQHDPATGETWRGMLVGGFVTYTTGA